jgi:TfoX/Sxy family transcriptional regulator of competence genes
MAWVKIPKENHPLFHAALPAHPGVSTILMFGGVAARVNGQMFAGLFARSAIVKLSPSDQQAALALDGAAMFDPMGNGRIMRDTVLLPEAVMEEPDELRSWFRKAFEYTSTLAPKTKRASAKSPAAKPPAAKAAGAKNAATTKKATGAPKKPGLAARATSRRKSPS